MNTTDDLGFKVADRLAVLTLNRPDKLNALSDAMIDTAVACLGRCATDPNVGAVLVTGAGRGFYAGGNLDRDARRRAQNVRGLRGPPARDARAFVAPRDGSRRSRSRQ